MTVPAPATGLKKKKISKSLSDLAIYCKAKTFPGFSEAREKFKCHHMSSFSEGKALTLLTKSTAEYLDFSKKQLVRIYPSGKRLNSSNYDPVLYWKSGCQLVALNFQTFGKHFTFTVGTALIGRSWDANQLGFLWHEWTMRLCPQTLEFT